MEKKIEKKELIRINPRKCKKQTDSNPYGYKNMHFAFVSSPVNDRVQCTALAACRESVNSAGYYCRFKVPGYSIHSFDEDAPVDFEKLRLLIVNDVDKEFYDDFKTKLFSGKALLNCYEKEMKWAPSKIATVKHPSYNNAWLLTGPKEWMSQPQLLSIATLFIRLMSVHGPLKENTTFQQTEDSLKTLYNNYVESMKNEEESGTFTYYSDIGLYLKHLDDIKLLLLNVKEVFNNINLEEAWSLSSNRQSFGMYSGILSFLENQHRDYNKFVAIANRRFMALKENRNAT